MRDRIIKLSINELSASQLLYQHDKGQMVEFLEDVEDNTLVLFENHNVSESAIPQSVKDNLVEIPDELLTEAGSLIITVKLVDSNSETTQKIIKVKIMAGAEAKTDVPPENQQTFIQKIMEIINSAKEMVKSIRDDADNGVFKGDKGDKGDTGDIGPIGPKGEQGIQGEQGPRGIGGQDGYTPVKGVDYFTETEKEEMAQDVVERINLSDKVGVFVLSGSAEPTGNANDYPEAKLGDICVNESYRAWICQYLHANTIAWLELLTPVSPYLANNFYFKAEVDKKLDEKADVKLATRERTWEKIRTINVPSDDYKGQTIDGVYYGYSGENGIKVVSFETDENGNLLESHQITGMQIKLTPTTGININQGFIIPNNFRGFNTSIAINYFTGIRNTTAIRWWEISTSPYNLNNTADNPARYMLPAQRLNFINALTFGGFEATSVLGEGTKIEVWAYGYWKETT